MKFRKAALLAGLVTTVTAVAHAQDTKQLNERAALGRAKGATEATVTVFEIADFQCPYCSRFAKEVFPRIDSAYVRTGKIKWIFMNLPLPSHANSWLAAEAAMCAGGVAGQFWGMHDRLFASQAEWSNLQDPSVVFARLAKDAGVQADLFTDCVKGDRTAALVVRDVLQAAGAGVTGTPAFVVNNEPIFAGYKPWDEWKEMIEAALKKPAQAAKQ